VALKIPTARDSTRIDRRFRIEARAIARLEHPGIVPIHDIGRLADGRPFYVMKRVHGRTLREYLGDVPDMAARLRILERLCEPVRFAHAHGVIHRDLKPDNIMIGTFGEVMVMDWGAALTTSVDAAAISSDPEDAIVGTRGFMAPEQEQAATTAVDCRADVFSLGAILYFLLANDSPPAAGVSAALRQRGIPRPLAAICEKALAPDRAHRYQTVAALDEDVANYRANLPVTAYRETPLERAARFGRTYRTAIVLVAGYIIMRALVAVLAGW
jgi:serine/threonine protein kinase